MSIRFRAAVAVGLLLASVGCSPVDFGNTDDVSRLKWQGPASTEAIAAAPAIRPPAYYRTPYYGSLLRLPDEALFWSTSTQDGFQH